MSTCGFTLYSKCAITLREPARTQARAALAECGIHLDSFFGPEFDGALELLQVYIDQQWVHVRSGEVTYSYPVADVARIKLTAA